MTAPVPILIVGPSGVGKSTIIGEIAKRYPQLERFQTTTTRPPRDAHDTRYHFVSRDEFERMIADGAFLEWTAVHGNLYGTERSRIEAILERGKYPFPSNAIDVKGVRAYEREFPGVLAIFIAYDSLAELPARIRRTRPEASEDEIARRLATANEEMAEMGHYRHVVHNHEGKLDQAVDEVARIIERSALFV